MREVIVPAGEGRAVRVKTGEVVRVVDVHGGQVGDLFAFVDGATTEWLSAEHTRPSIRRLFPRPGDTALTNHRREILRVEEDHSPGWHDTLYAACDPARYARLGFEGAHRSCATNLIEAMHALDEDLSGTPQPVIPPPVVPQPFNLFMHVDVGPDGVLDVVPATSSPGDAITFRALLDIVAVVSSCPMDLVHISTGGVTELRIEVS
jgi:uncharacterized protein YcgI (DUF1989 family)